MGGEFPNREFPRSGIDGNSSGIPFSKMAFSGIFIYRVVLIYLQGGASALRHRNNPYLRLQNQKRTGAKSDHSGPA